MFKINITSISLATAVAVSSLIAQPAIAGSWTGTPARITSVHARDNFAEIYIEGSENPAGCTQTGVMRIENSVPNRPDLIATALTAFSLGKPITAYVSGCSSDGVPLILTVWAHSN